MIYLDNNASTRVDPEVFSAMKPYLEEDCANPHSLHSSGQKAMEAVERARQQVADLINANADEIYFTSGATESNNLALAGFARFEGDVRIVTSSIEHKSVLECATYLRRSGWNVSFLKPDGYGMISSDAIEKTLKQPTGLLSIMWANNETGTINPIDDIAKLAFKHGAFLHTDATQAVGRLKISVKNIGIDMLSLSAHKIYGPKGVGAIYISKSPRVRLTPIIHGGGQEKALRSGTLNVPGIVGMGKACELAKKRLNSDPARIKKMRDTLEEKLKDTFPDLKINGHSQQRLCNTLNFSIVGLDGKVLQEKLNDRVAISNGSACNAGQPSYVLTAMSIEEEQIEGAVRISLGKFNTPEEIEMASTEISQAIKQSIRHD